MHLLLKSTKYLASDCKSTYIFKKTFKKCFCRHAGSSSINTYCFFTCCLLCSDTVWMAFTSSAADLVLLEFTVA